jgi:hypothetical protein
VLSLQLLADYYNVDYARLKFFYGELQKDFKFLNALNEQIRAVRKQYSKGLFGKGRLNSIDWFANQRITLYILIRLLKPRLAVETGVFYGGTTAFILNALHKNRKGRLVSIDLPAQKLEKIHFVRHEKVDNSELLSTGLRPGFIIPDYLKKYWEFIEQESIPTVKKIKGEFTFFSHDSEHRRDYMFKELNVAMSKMPSCSTIMADDIDWSNGFLDFCVRNKLYPLFLTDNGKSGLKVRLGIVRLDHPNIGKHDVTG